MSLMDRSYSAKRDTFAGQAVSNHVQVTDQREKLDGWELQIRQVTPFMHASGTELKGLSYTWAKCRLSQQLKAL